MSLFLNPAPSRTILFHITFAVNVLNDTYGTRTSLKVVLTPLNANHYRLFKS
jgi:hypothetical protein